MTNHCDTLVTCQNGNCPGCKDGKLWCLDPRCAPNCQDCPVPKGFNFNTNALFFIWIILLLAILFIVWFVYGPSFFAPHDDHKHANVIV